MIYPPESSWNDPPTGGQMHSMNKALRILKRPEVTEMNRPDTRWQARDAMKELWDEVASRPRVKAAAIKNNLENKKMENNPGKPVTIIKCSCCMDKGAKDFIRVLLQDDKKRLEKEKGPKVSIDYINSLVEALSKLPVCE